MARGAVLTMDEIWAFANAWYADRLERGWRRKTGEEAAALFASIGLTGEFWRIG
jgi:hypothetical protein